MFQSFLNTATTLTANSAIPFGENLFGNWFISHSSGSTGINIRYPGLYLVQFNADVTIGTTGPVTLQLNVNSNPVTAAKATSTVTASEVSNVSFNTFVNALPYYNSMQTLTVNCDAAATINFANITILRVQ